MESLKKVLADNATASAENTRTFAVNGRTYCVKVINKLSEWEDVKDDFIKSMGDLKMVGFDCEWIDGKQFEYKDQRDDWRVFYSGPWQSFNEKMENARKENGRHGRVALIQMASIGGMVLLIRSCYFGAIIGSLKEFLQDQKFVKLGVNIQHDAAKLYEVSICS